MKTINDIQFNSMLSNESDELQRFCTTVLIVYSYIPYIYVYFKLGQICVVFTYATTPTSDVNPKLKIDGKILARKCMKETEVSLCSW